MRITFLPCLSLLRLAIWKEEVMATILVTKMDREDKGYTLEMLEWQEEGCVPKVSMLELMSVLAILWKDISSTLV